MPMTATVKSAQAATNPATNPATGKPFAFPVGLVVTVTFSDGVTSDDILFNNITSAVQLAQLVQRQLDAYAQTQTIVATPPASGQPVDLSVLTPTPVDLTPDQIAANAYQKALGVLNQVNVAVTAGALASDDALVTSAKAAVATSFTAVKSTLDSQVTVLTASSVPVGG